MDTLQIRWAPHTGWVGLSATDVGMCDAHLVLVFADSGYFYDAACYNALREYFPRAHIVGCSSAGNMLGSLISDEDLVATAIKFEHGRARMAVADITAAEDTKALAAGLMEQLQGPDLRHVLVFSDGLLVNGSALATGLNAYGVSVTGGLAGDGDRFEKTWVMADAPAKSGRIAAIGLYGDMIVKSGCASGCLEFGAEREITSSSGNIVYEIDGQPALSLYKKYLGELAKDLPGSGLRFPLSVKASKSEKAVIRTLLAVDEVTQSLTFAGDVPQRYLCRLMKTNLDNLVESAGLAAGMARLPRHQSSGLCLVVSCVGRRLVLGQLTEDEIEVVQEQMGSRCTLTGFYSYGELAPFSELLQCQLHNQTMTLTVIYD